MALAKSISLIVFDLDGTLVDLPIDWVKVKQSAGISDGQKLGDRIEQLLDANDKMTLDSITDLEMEALGQAIIPSYLPQALTQLCESFKVAILTRNSREVARSLLQRIGLKDVYIIGREDISRLKPDPEGLQRILDHFAIEPGNAVLVGDTHHDVEAAHALGLSVVVVTSVNTKYRPEGADAYVDKISELHSIIKH